MKMRELKCDHATEHPKEHPVSEYINIGNFIIGMCGTCYQAIKGQILEGEITEALKEFLKAKQNVG